MASKVLFVDDEADLQFMVAAFFEASGYEVIGAINAEEAKQRSDGKSFQAIILDVNLPGVEGSAGLVDHFKRVFPGTPIILYTGNAGDDPNVKELLKRGADRYLLKDGSLANLLGAVNDVCR